MGARRSFAERQKYHELRSQGATQKEAASRIGINIKTAQAWDKGMRDSSGESYKEASDAKKLSGPIPISQLGKRPTKALDDFEYFRRAYFGRLSSPWQIDAAEKMNAFAQTDGREFVVLNMPPGGGKSTLLHDIEAWMTCRNRRIRGLLGSRVQDMASKYSRRLKGTFERARPVFVDPDMVAAGRAVEPESSLPRDFGRFVPNVNELWKADQFVVAQILDLVGSEKEATWQAYGLDTNYLGNRVDISVWDDAVTMKDLRTLEAIGNLCERFDSEAESRIEPGGLLALVGQRLAPNDLYRYCLDKIRYEVSEEDEEALFGEGDSNYADMYVIEPEGSQKPRMYHHIVYPAHDDANCKRLHKKSDPALLAGGCLLEPYRLPWAELRTKQIQNNSRYQTVYQQEDISAEDTLIPREYIVGGMYNGEELIGCYDRHRKYHEVPKGLSPDSCDIYSIVTVDPSPTMFWSIQWWIYDAKSQLRFLMDLVRRKMDAGAFLDFNPQTGEFFGVLDELWMLSESLNFPFKTLIIERNGAQRFLMQLEYFRQWCQKRNVNYYPHETTSNKSDPEYGVQTIATHYRHGRYRLPNSAEKGDMGFAISRLLVEEAVAYPYGATNDCVMAQWFMEWWLPRLVTPDLSGMPSRPTPSWL